MPPLFFGKRILSYECLGNSATIVIDMQHFSAAPVLWYALQGGDDKESFKKVFVNVMLRAAAVP